MVYIMSKKTYSIKLKTIKVMLSFLFLHQAYIVDKPQPSGPKASIYC